MRSHVHAFLLVSLLLLACFPALGNTWSDHPAVEQFHVDTEALPGTLYLVRTRGELPPGTVVTVHAEKNGLFLVSGPEGEVMALVQLGCGVFPLYEPGDEPETTSRIWETISVPDPSITAMVEAVNWPELAARIQWLVDFGTRYSLADNHLQVAEAIGEVFSEYGLFPEYHSFDYNGNTLWNVLATQTGNVHPDSFFIVCGHFDSVSDNPYVMAPGADDNGTGTTVVLSAARILSEYSFRYSIIYICFGGEEQGLKGSQAYASWAASTGLGIVGVLNFDMLGYWQPGVEADLEVESDDDSQWLAEAILNAADLYTETPYELHVYNGAWWGDHASFWAEGFAAVNHEEAWDWGDPDFNPYYHSTQDLLDYIGEDFMVGNTRLAIAALATLAQPDGSGSSNHCAPVDPSSRETLMAAPNPFTDTVSFEVFGMGGRMDADIGVYDLSGREITRLRVPLSEGSGSILWNASEIPGSGGVYFARITGSSRDCALRLVRIR